MVNDNDYFDVEALIEEHDKEFVADPVVEEVIEEVIEDTTPIEEKEIVETVPVIDEVEEEIIEEIVEEEITEEVVEEEIIEDTEVVETDVDTELHKRNEAFKAMRLEKERLEKENVFINELADSYGMTPDELRTRFAEDQAKKEAEKQGMTTDQYKRMRDLEAQVTTLEEGRREERFNMYADKFIADKKLDDTGFKDLAMEAAKLGFDLMNHPEQLEVAYKAINYDKAVAHGRQVQLAETKRRRETSDGATGLTGGVVDGAEDFDKEIDAYLKEQGII